MAPFDRDPMTSYRRSIVNVAVSRVVSEIFNVEKYRDLEVPAKSQSKSVKVKKIKMKFVNQNHKHAILLPPNIQR